MNKKAILVIILIYVIMLGLNFITPMCYGDDYVYAFIWPKQSMFIPLPETVARVMSLKDVFVSQWLHYFTGNGRTVAHLFVQFFIWQGKQLFNFFNAFVFILLILEIYWISDRGEISFKNLRPGLLCWIFFVLWAFIAGFGGVYLWIAGSCNYLWMVVLLLTFLLLYVHKYFHMNITLFTSKFAAVLVFLWGAIAGWTNENTVCWIILFLGVWLYQCKRGNQLEQWMSSGFIGLCLGYILLIIAPGNAVRASYYVENSINIFSQEVMKYKFISFCQIELFQILLWYYIVTSFRKLKVLKDECLVSKTLRVSKSFCMLSLLANLIMFLSPEFKVRSGFPSLVFLTIAAALLIQLQHETGKRLIEVNARKFLTIIGCCYFLITLIGTYWGMNVINQYDKTVIKAAYEYRISKSNETLLISRPPEISKQLSWLAGHHLIEHTLSENEDDWQNVAFARYFGIKGVCLEKDNKSETVLQK